MYNGLATQTTVRDYLKQRYGVDPTAIPEGSPHTEEKAKAVFAASVASFAAMGFPAWAAGDQLMDLMGVSAKQDIIYVNGQAILGMSGDIDE